MPGEFRVLNVIEDDARILACLPHEQLSDTKVPEALFLDFDELARSGTRTVTLDLRSVKFFEGTVPGRLLRLANALKAAGGSLVVLAAPNICEVLRALQLDRVFRLSETDETETAESEQKFRLP